MESIPVYDGGMLHTWISRTSVRMLHMPRGSAWFHKLFRITIRRRRSEISISILCIAMLTPLLGLYNSCTELGYQLPILTFPGQDANRPLSSLPSSAISTSRSRSQTTGTTLVNPFATISQTAITSLPGPLTTTEPSTTPTTESTTTSSPTATTSSGKKIIGGTALRAWVQVMEILVVCFSII